MAGDVILSFQGLLAGSAQLRQILFSEILLLNCFLLRQDELLSQGA